MLRAAVTIVVVLVIAKLGVETLLYRQATESVIVTTFRSDAIRACAHAGTRSALRAPAKVWSDEIDIVLQIGKPNVDVQFWQINHRLWSSRFQSPILRVMTTASGSQLRCEYDINRGLASVELM